MARVRKGALESLGAKPLPRCLHLYSLCLPLATILSWLLALAWELLQFFSPRLLIAIRRNYAASNQLHTTLVVAAFTRRDALFQPVCQRPRTLTK